MTTFYEWRSPDGDGFGGYRTREEAIATALQSAFYDKVTLPIDEVQAPVLWRNMEKLGWRVRAYRGTTMTLLEEVRAD